MPAGGDPQSPRAGLLGVRVLVVLVLVAVGVDAWRVSRQPEVRARRALWSVREAVAGHDPEGLAELDALLHDPELVGTAAATEAWQLWATAAPTPEARLEALVAVWVYSDNPEPALCGELARALRSADLERPAAAVEPRLDPLVPGGARSASPGGRLDRALDALSRSEPGPELPPRAGPPRAGVDPDGIWSGDEPGAPRDVVWVHRRGRPPTAVAASSSDSDGLFALGPEVTPWAPGSVEEHLPAHAVDAADLDGDGNDEVVVVAGDQVRLYDAEGAVRARLRLSGVDVALAADGTIWVLAPGQLVPVRLVAGGLVPGAPIPLDRGAGGLFAADVDGDGEDELILDRGSGFGVHAAGETEWVPFLEVRRRLQADDDAAVELLVDAGGGPRVLGAGLGSLPPRSGPAALREDVPDGAGLPERLRPAWGRAAKLAGLGAPALPRLVDLARASRAPAHLRIPILEAALSRQSRPDPGELTAAVLALDPTVPPDAATLALARQTHPFDAGQALALTEVTDTLAFHEPLPPWVEVGRSGTVRRDAEAGVLALEASGHVDRLLRVAIQSGGEPVCIDLSLTLTELDPLASLRLVLSDGQLEHELELCRTGEPGGSSVELGMVLLSSGPSGFGPDAETRVSICVTDDQGTLSARLDDSPRRVSPSRLARGSDRLTLELSGRFGQRASRRFRAELHRVSLRGGRFVRTAAPSGAAALAFAESGRGATDPLGRALELGAAGRPDDVDWASLSADDVVWLLRGDAARWAAPAARALGDEFPTRFADAWVIAAEAAEPSAMAALRAPGLPPLPPITADLRLLSARRGQAWLDVGALERAREVLDGLPSDPEVAATRARLALRSGHPEEVAVVLREALAATRAPEPVLDRFAADPELAAWVADLPALPPAVRGTVPGPGSLR